MHIDHKVEPWLRTLLNGVENSNHAAEVVATQAYFSSRLVDEGRASFETMMRLADQVEHKGHREIADQLRQQSSDLRAALATLSST